MTDSNRAIGTAVDVYALGAILYEMLAGRPPFKAASLLETIEQVREHDPVPPRSLQPKVPRDLETICLKCLEKNPQRRYESAAKLAADLHAFLHEEPISAQSLTVLDQVARTISFDGRKVALSPREFLLLRHLMRHPDAVCTREELLSEVWGYAFDPATNVVDVCVARLRHKLRGDLIDTVRNVGYRFNAP